MYIYCFYSYHAAISVTLKNMFDVWSLHSAARTREKNDFLNTSGRREAVMEIEGEKATLVSSKHGH